MFEKYHYTLFLFILLPLASLLLAQNVLAQSSWNQCTDSSFIIERCETYDCPNGDSNKDGSCGLADNGARLTDVRNDSFCANPLSGCGEVRYYPKNSTSSCLVRVEETGDNCNLYTVVTPEITPAPQPKATPTVRPTPRSTITPVKTVNEPVENKEELPETGFTSYIGVALVSMGVLGLIVYDKFRFI